MKRFDTGLTKQRRHSGDPQLQGLNSLKRFPHLDLVGLIIRQDFCKEKIIAGRLPSDAVSKRQLIEISINNYNWRLTLR